MKTAWRALCAQPKSGSALPGLDDDAHAWRLWLGAAALTAAMLLAALVLTCQQSVLKGERFRAEQRTAVQLQASPPTKAALWADAGPALAGPGTVGRATR